MKKKILTLALTALFVLAFSVVAYADTDPITTIDVASILTTSLAGFLPQMMAVITGVAPVVIAVVIAQVGIGWGIRIFRSLTGR